MVAVTRMRTRVRAVLLLRTARLFTRPGCDLIFKSSKHRYITNYYLAPATSIVRDERGDTVRYFWQQQGLFAASGRIFFFTGFKLSAIYFFLEILSFVFNFRTPRLRPAGAEGFNLPPRCWIRLNPGGPCKPERLHVHRAAEGALCLRFCVQACSSTAGLAHASCAVLCCGPRPTPTTTTPIPATDTFST